MKVKVQNLTGAALDWAVTQAHFIQSTARSLIRSEVKPYSTDWSQGGPIIEREVPSLIKTNASDWIAQSAYDFANDCEAPRYYGPTPLIAAMRCYVASHFGSEVEGDEINVPDELVEN